MSDPDGPVDLSARDERVVPMRLQKFLARAGVASRRGSEDLMTAGRVAVNGAVVRELGAKVDPAVDHVTVDGEEVSLSDRAVVILLNKPAGAVTTMDDPQGRPTVAALVPVERYPGLFPVGRLDQDTTGLLVFTTDGELGHRLLHPRHKVEKVYRAEVDGAIGDAGLAALREGIDLDDGRTAPAIVELVRRGTTSVVLLTIREGRKRQVRRMFSAVGHPVLALHRERFGPLALDDLATGAWRLLDDADVARLRASAGLED